MNEAFRLASATVMGVLLGAVFYGGLWWTVRRGVSSGRATLWFPASLILRIGVALTGFHIVAGGHWQRLIMCVAGFAIARLSLTWLTRPSRRHRREPAAEGNRAP